MTELINKQKVLDLVRDICIDIMDECESYIDVIDGETDIVYKNLKEVNAILKCNKRIRNGIRQLPSEPLGNSEQLEWILCSVRPPEIDEEVFVYLFGDSPYLAWYDGHKWQTEDFTVDDDERPTAWMSLPKPWEGENR